jgi:hypothetical protein
MTVNNRLILPHIDRIWERALPEGGFVSREKGKYRPDATAWAILALSAAGTKADLLASSRARLTINQLDDGRVTISPNHPDVFWPTPLAILAWHGSNSQVEHKSQAIEFLINTTGRHWKRKPDSPVAHDTGIQGWPWIENTHSWVEPTALALMALKISGYGAHQRVQQATRMLLDRQLNQGGWNYGNTIVFGQKLRPMPEYTGMALNALAGQVAKEKVKQSLTYLKSQAVSLVTPLSLGWSLLGLGAWGERPIDAQTRIIQSLELQKKYGIYDTLLLDLLIVCFFAKEGLVSILS